MTRRILFLVALLFGGFYAEAQQSGQVGVFDFLPQSVYANPALRPAARINIGIPALSQLHFNHGNNWFVPSKYLENDAGGNIRLDVDKILSNMDDYAFLGQSVGIELVHVGFKFGKHYVHARAAERIQIGIDIPKDIFNLAAYGNVGSHAFKDNTADFSGLAVNGIHYREYVIGYNYQLNEKWTFGLAAKYLYGMESIDTESSNLKLRTDPLTYELHTSGGFKVNTAGIVEKDGKGIHDDMNTYLLKLKNNGFGGDFGATYRPLKRLQVEFSANDIGFIKWRNNVTNYGTNDASFAYGGIDLTDFVFLQGSDFNDAFDDHIDSLLSDLENVYGFDATENEFTTSINGYFRYAAAYDLLQIKKCEGKAWLSMYHGIGKSQVPFSFSLGYNQKLWKVLQADVHYTKSTKFAGSMGFGLSVNAGPFQIYCLAENFHFANYTKITLIDQNDPENKSTLVYFNNPQDIRINVGMNLTFGRKDKDSPRGVPMKR